MAKSLRSKTKRAFRRIKREDPKSDYALKDKIRIQRLNEKLKVLKAVDGSEEDVVDEREESDDIAAEGQGDAMTVDSEIPKDEVSSNATPNKKQSQSQSNGISTSGPRLSSRLEWKKNRGLPLRRKRTEKNSTTFGPRKTYKSVGKRNRSGRSRKRALVGNVL